MRIAVHSLSILGPGELELIGDQLEQLWRDFLAATPRLAVGLVAILITWLFASLATRIVRSVLSRTSMRESLRALLAQLAYAALWVGGLLVAMNLAFPSLTPAKTLTALGVGSIAIGFAFKDIFENFFAGVLILWRFPFEIGDWIRCGDLVGKVEETTVRMTLVRQVDGRLLLVPNARLFKEPVEVLTAQELARVEVAVGVAYKEDAGRARDIILAALKEQPTVACSHPTDVQLDAFGSSSIDFRVLWWTGSEPQARRESRDEVLLAIKQALDEAGIEIPFPHRTLTFAAGDLNRLAGVAEPSEG
ncbi:MAG: mechanosensitive ion channel family protein [Planctomycetota bacterium]